MDIFWNYTILYKRFNLRGNWCACHMENKINGFHTGKAAIYMTVCSGDYMTFFSHKGH